MQKQGAFTTQIHALLDRGRNGEQKRKDEEVMYEYKSLSVGVGKQPRYRERYE